MGQASQSHMDLEAEWPKTMRNDAPFTWQVFSSNQATLLTSEPEALTHSHSLTLITSFPTGTMVPRDWLFNKDLCMLIVSKHDDFQEYYWPLPFDFHCYYPQPTAVNGLLAWSQPGPVLGKWPILGTNMHTAWFLACCLCDHWMPPVVQATHWHISCLAQPKRHNLIYILIDVWWPTLFSSNFPTALLLPAAMWHWSSGAAKMNPST